MAIIDCRTCEIVAWQLELRCRTDEAIAPLESAAAVYAIEPGELALGSDNGSASPLGDSRPNSPSSASATGAAATATPKARPSSKAGSEGSRNGRCG
jgi:hypothetical protein